MATQRLQIISAADRSRVLTHLLLLGFERQMWGNNFPRLQMCWDTLGSGWGLYEHVIVVTPYTAHYTVLFRMAQMTFYSPDALLAWVTTTIQEYEHGTIDQ
jgi:hypothetical protein